MADITIHNFPVEITSFRTGDCIAVDGPQGTAKMSKDALLHETAQNALGGIKIIDTAATEADLKADNYFASDGPAGPKKVSAEIIRGGIQHRYFSRELTESAYRKNLDVDIIPGCSYTVKFVCDIPITTGFSVRDASDERIGDEFSISNESRSFEFTAESDESKSLSIHIHELPEASPYIGISADFRIYIYNESLGIAKSLVSVAKDIETAKGYNVSVSKTTTHPTGSFEEIPVSVKPGTVTLYVTNKWDDSEVPDNYSVFKVVDDNGQQLVDNVSRVSNLQDYYEFETSGNFTISVRGNIDEEPSFDIVASGENVAMLSHRLASAEQNISSVAKDIETAKGYNVSVSKTTTHPTGSFEEIPVSVKPGTVTLYVTNKWDDSEVPDNYSVFKVVDDNGQQLVDNVSRVSNLQDYYEFETSGNFTISVRGNIDEEPSFDIVASGENVAMLSHRLTSVQDDVDNSEVINLHDKTAYWGILVLSGSSAGNTYSWGNRSTYNHICFEVPAGVYEISSSIVTDVSVLSKFPQYDSSKKPQDTPVFLNENKISRVIGRRYFVISDTAYIVLTNYDSAVHVDKIHMRRLQGSGIAHDVNKMMFKSSEVLGVYDSALNILIADKVESPKTLRICAKNASEQNECTVYAVNDYGYRLKICSFDVGGVNAYASVEVALPCLCASFNVLYASVVASESNPIDIRECSITNTIPGSRFGISVDAHLGLEVFAPENSLKAYQLAAMNGYRTLVVNIRETSDGELYCYHFGKNMLSLDGGETLTSLTAEQFAEKTSEEIDAYTMHITGRYENAEPMCRFEDVVRLAASRGIELYWSVHQPYTSSAYAKIKSLILTYGLKGHISIKDTSPTSLTEVYAALGGDDVVRGVCLYTLSSSPNVSNICSRMAECDFGDCERRIGLAFNEATKENCEIITGNGYIAEIEEINNNDIDEIRDKIKNGVSRIMLKTIPQII